MTSLASPFTSRLGCSMKPRQTKYGCPPPYRCSSREQGSTSMTADFTTSKASTEAGNSSPSESERTDCPLRDGTDPALGGSFAKLWGGGGLSQTLVPTVGRRPCPPMVRSIGRCWIEPTGWGETTRRQLRSARFARKRSPGSWTPGRRTSSCSLTSLSSGRRGHNGGHRFPITVPDSARRRTSRHSPTTPTTRGKRIRAHRAPRTRPEFESHSGHAVGADPAGRRAHPGSLWPSRSSDQVTEYLSGSASGSAVQADTFCGWEPGRNAILARPFSM